MVVQRGFGEGQNRVGNIVTRSLDGNVIVLLEVDTSVLLRRVIGGTEKLAFDAGVGRARDVLAVFPLTIARSTSMSTTTTTAAAGTTASARVAVAVAVELRATVIPASATATTRLLLRRREVGSRTSPARSRTSVKGAVAV